MKLEQLQHLVRAAAGILDADGVLVVGSQALLASHPEAETVLAVERSTEADIMTISEDATAAWLLDGTIGKDSPFHQQFGVYAKGVDGTTARLPKGWRERLVPLPAPGERNSVGLCLGSEDGWVAKALAGREKDWAYCVELVARGMVDVTGVRRLAASMDLSDEERRRIEGMISRGTRGHELGG